MIPSSPVPPIQSSRWMISSRPLMENVLPLPVCRREYAGGVPVQRRVEQPLHPALDHHVRLRGVRRETRVEVERPVPHLQRSLVARHRHQLLLPAPQLVRVQRPDAHHHLDRARGASARAAEVPGAVDAVRGGRGRRSRARARRGAAHRAHAAGVRGLHRAAGRALGHALLQARGRSGGARGVSRPAPHRWNRVSLLVATGLGPGRRHGGRHASRCGPPSRQPRLGASPGRRARRSARGRGRVRHVERSFARRLPFRDATPSCFFADCSAC